MQIYVLFYNTVKCTYFVYTEYSTFELLVLKKKNLLLYRILKINKIGILCNIMIECQYNKNRLVTRSVFQAAKSQIWIFDSVFRSFLTCMFMLKCFII